MANNTHTHTHNYNIIYFSFLVIFPLILNTEHFSPHHHMSENYKCFNCLNKPDLTDSSISRLTYIVTYIFWSDTLQTARQITHLSRLFSSSHLGKNYIVVGWNSAYFPKINQIYLYSMCTCFLKLSVLLNGNNPIFKLLLVS